jgi:hypothetical protein
MKILNAFRDGMRRVAAAPAILLGVLLLTFLVALPLGLVLNDMLRGSLGSSVAADAAASGVNYEWWQEFSAQAAGVGTSFTPRVIGFGGVLDNVSSVLDNAAHPLALAGTGAAYVLIWLFLAGGILDRYARNRALRAGPFFAACGVFFFRFLRLAVLALAAYAFLFAYVHSWLLDGFYAWATRDMVVERTAFLVRLLLYVVFGILLLACNLLFDYAKIRAVVEDRRSMIGALMAALRFVRRQPLDAIGLYLLDGLLFILLLAAYSIVAPGAGGGGLSMWAGLLVTQLYLLLRLSVKLLFYASQISLFQASLAHAHYAAGPLPAWPESPAAEAIRPTADPGT